MYMPQFPVRPMLVQSVAFVVVVAALGTVDLIKRGVGHVVGNCSEHNLGNDNGHGKAPEA